MADSIALEDLIDPQDPLQERLRSRVAELTTSIFDDVIGEKRYAREIRGEYPRGHRVRSLTTIWDAFRAGRDPWTADEARVLEHSHRGMVASFARELDRLVTSAPDG